VARCRSIARSPWRVPLDRALPVARCRSIAPHGAVPLGRALPRAADAARLDYQGAT